LRLSAAGSHIVIVLLTDLQIVATLQNSGQCSDALHLPIWIPQGLRDPRAWASQGKLKFGEHARCQVLKAIF